MKHLTHNMERVVLNLDAGHPANHHCRTTSESADAWWARYFTDMQFRFDEELLAHRAEWLSLIEGQSRQVRRRALEFVAKKLASPLYGRMMSANKCAEAIKGDL